MTQEFSLDKKSSVCFLPSFWVLRLNMLYSICVLHQAARQHRSSSWWWQAKSIIIRERTHSNQKVLLWLMTLIRSELSCSHTKWIVLILQVSLSICLTIKIDMVILNHNAQNFPNLCYQPQHAQSQADTRVLFDRIVCDVPCSSDAAIRKIPQKWEKWST